MPPPFGTPYFSTVSASLWANRGSGQAYGVGTCLFVFNGYLGRTDTALGDCAGYVGAIQPWNPVTRQGFVGGVYGDGNSHPIPLDFSQFADGTTPLVILGRYSTFYGAGAVYLDGEIGTGGITVVAAESAPPLPGGALRVATCGFEVQQTGPGPESNNVQKGLTPGRVVGHAFTVAGFVDGVTPGSTQWFVDPADAVTRRAHHERFYIRVREYPVAASQGLRIHGCHGSIEGTDDAFITVLAADGTLQWFNKGNGTRTFACQITTPLELDVWYRVSLFYNFNNSGDAFAANDTGVFVAMVRPSSEPHRLIINGDPATNVFDVMFNDTDSPTITGDTGTLFTVVLNVSGTQFRTAYSQPNWAGYKGAHVSSNGLSFSSSQRWSRTTFGIANFAQPDTDGGIVDLDDFVADAGISPGPGWIIPYYPVAAGTYAEWSGNQDWRGVAQLPTASGSASPNAVINTVGGSPGKKLSFLLAPPVGVIGTIRSVQVGLYGGMARTNWKFLLVVNGVDHTADQAAANTTNGWLALTASHNGVGWLVDAASIGGISGADILEVGVVDGTQANANTSWLSQVLLLVEHEAVDPPLVESASGDIRIELGTYTGNDTYQFIPTLAQADLLFLRPDGANGGVWWTALHGPNGNFAVRLDASDQFRGSVLQVTPSGFTVIQNGFSNLNPAATTVRYLAITDPSRRMLALGGYMPNSAGAGAVAVPNTTVTLDDPTFLLEALFVLAGFSSGTGKHAYRGPAQVSAGDKSSYLDQATADRASAIISMGGFQFLVGSILVSSNFDQGWYAGFRTSGVFNTQILCQIGSYTGNGNTSQTVVFPTPLSAAGLILVIPTTARQRLYRFASDATSRNLTSGASVSGGITAFSALGFTVGNTNGHNTALEAFNYIAFADSTPGGPDRGPGPGEPPPTPPYDQEVGPDQLRLALALGGPGTDTTIEFPIDVGPDQFRLGLTLGGPGSDITIDIPVDVGPDQFRIAAAVADATITVPPQPCPQVPGGVPSPPAPPSDPLPTAGAAPTPPAPPGPCT